VRSRDHVRARRFFVLRSRGPTAVSACINNRFGLRWRLITSDLLDCFLALMAEVQQQRLHELLVQQMTRAVPVAVGVASVG
jgi:hypothetical protein